MLMSSHVECVHFSHISQRMPQSFALTDLCQTVHGYLIGPGFTSTSPENNSNHDSMTVRGKPRTNTTERCERFPLAATIFHDSTDW